MDILDSLTCDYDQLRYLVTDFSIASSPHREALFKELVNLQEVSAKAESSALVYTNQGWDGLERAARRMLERCDVMEDLARSISRTPTQELRDAKMELFCDLVLQRIEDSEKEILPELFDTMSDEDREMVGKIYERYKEVGGATHSGLRAV
jgi:hypothetical protein